MKPSQDHRLNFLAFVLALFLSLVFFAASANCQDIPAADAAEIRKLIVRLEAAEEKAAELEKQREAWKANAGEWEKLYLAEKDRADRVQGARIDALNIALGAERESVRLLRDQVKEDQQYIKSLEKRNASLKRQRWLFGIAGFAAGTYVGGRINF